MDLYKLQRFAKALNITYVCNAITVVALLYILTSPAIVNPVAEFVFAGVVPGTNTVLSPDAILIGLAVIAGLVAVVVLLAMLRRSVTARRSLAAAPSSPSIPFWRRLPLASVSAGIRRLFALLFRNVHAVAARIDHIKLLHPQLGANATSLPTTGKRPVRKPVS